MPAMSLEANAGQCDRCLVKARTWLGGGDASPVDEGVALCGDSDRCRRWVAACVDGSVGMFRRHGDREELA